MHDNEFINTLNLEGEDLKKANAMALAQECIIAAIFKANPGRKLSPSQVHSIMQVKCELRPLLTSVRRGMSNLCDKKNAYMLTKLQTKVPGNYGMPEHLWMLTSGMTDEDRKNEYVYKKGEPSAADFASKLIIKPGKQGEIFSNSSST